MRTTVTIDPDVEATLRAYMRERDLSFKEALNLAIRAGLQKNIEKKGYRLPSFAMGVPTQNLDKALLLAAVLDDEEITRKLSLGKMKLLDANLLLYAVNRTNPAHTLAKDWLESVLSASETVAFSWTVLLAFLRVSTMPRIFPHPLTADQAFALVEGWLAQPCVTILEPTTRHIAILKDLIAPLGTAANLLPDAHLGALSIEHGAELYSCDNDFARFPRVRWVNPLRK